MALIIVTKLHEVTADALEMNQELQNLKITKNPVDQQTDAWKQTLGSGTCEII